MVKILDKYVISSILLSFFICVFAIISFFIIVDLFENFHRFLAYFEKIKKTPESEQSLFFLIFFHYTYLCPVIFYLFAPIMTVIAVILTLARMQHSKELLILQSMSVSTFRITIPFLMLATIIASGMFSVQEYLIPRYANEIISTNKIKKARRIRTNIQYKDNQGKIFYIGILDPLIKKIKNTRITIFHNKKYKVKKIIEAKIGTWSKDEKLILKQGFILEYDNNKKYPIPKNGYSITTEMTLYKLLTPEKNLDVLSISELKNLYSKYKNADVLVTLHSRWTIPISVIFLVLFSVSILLKSSEDEHFVTIGICILVTVVFYCVNIGCLSLGEKELITPIFAAWFPILLLGAAAISVSVPSTN